MKKKITKIEDIKIGSVWQYGAKTRLTVTAHNTNFEGKPVPGKVQWVYDETVASESSDWTWFQNPGLRLISEPDPILQHRVRRKIANP